MSSWFSGGSSSSSKEQMRKDERQMRSANRELTSDLRQLERKEKELMIQIKALAKTGQKDACSLLAKQLVQLRKQKTRNINTGAQISSMASRGKQMQSQNTMAKILGSTAQTMKKIDQQTPIHVLNNDMREFARAQDTMDQRTQLMDDVLDDIFDVGEDAENAIINQVLDEIGVETHVKLNNIPGVDRNALDLESVSSRSGTTERNRADNFHY